MDISQKIKDLISESKSLTQGDRLINPNYNISLGRQKQEEAEKLLQSTYGYSPDLTKEITSYLWNPREDKARSMFKGYGDWEDIEKNFGGYQGLVDYLAKGGTTQQTEIPLTKAIEGGVETGGMTGGKTVLTPTEKGLGLAPGTAGRGDVIQMYAERLGREPNEAELQQQVGKVGISDLQNWLGRQKWEGPMGFTPGGLGLSETGMPKAREEFTAMASGQPSPTYADLAKAQGLSYSAGGGTTPTIGGTVGGKTSENPYLQAIMDYIKKKEAEPTESEQYTKYKEQLGIPGLEATQTGVQKQISDVENLLDKLEGDIASRSQGKLVTMPQQRRYLAAEGKPLREQYTELLRGQTTTGTQLSSAREELARLMGLETEADRTAELLPFLKELATYESPSDEAKRKLAEMIAEEEAQKKAGVAEYYQKPTEQWSDPYQLGGDWVQKNKTTGEIRTAVNVPAGEGGGGTTTLATTLYNVGLNSTMVDNKGKLTESNLAKLGKAGIPPSLADEIMSFIVKGQTLEEIRGILATRFGKDKGFKHLDDFMQTLQRKGVSGGGADDFFNSL